MYEKVKAVHNMANVWMLKDRKNPVARYRSFLDTLYKICLTSFVEAYPLNQHNFILFFFFPIFDPIKRKWGFPLEECCIYMLYILDPLVMISSSFITPQHSKWNQPKRV